MVRIPKPRLFSRDGFESFMKRSSSVEGGVCYPETITVYAPTCNDTCISAVSRLRAELTDMFGGSTSYSAEGCWYDSESGETICEPVVVIEAAHNCLNKEQTRKLVDAIKTYADEANQKYIAVSQGKFYVMPSKAFDFQG